MSKAIRLTQEMIEKMKQEFEQDLSSAKMMDGKFSFTRSFTTQNVRAKLLFEPVAYAKMVALVQEFGKEVAWNCVADRGENENEYIVSDILVYPQNVTAATVEMNAEEYGAWLTNGVMSGDERYNKLRGQGHSHVNMGTGASGTDMDHQRKTLDQLRQDGFYIFIIWNKRCEHTFWIYDLAVNTVFEDKDIDFGIRGCDIDAFLADAKAVVKDRVTSLTPAQKYTPATTYKPTAAPAVKTAAPVKEKEKKEKTKVKASPYQSAYAYNAYSDSEDPTDPFYFSDYYYGWER